MRGLPAEERKNLILDQAQRLFVERGFAATTVEDILNRAGIAKGTLYHHFSGKEDIMRQLIARTTMSCVKKPRQQHHPMPIPLKNLLKS